MGYVYRDSTSLHYKWSWRTPRNAVGFAAECASYAMAYYRDDSGGRNRRALRRAIEAVQMHVRGEDVPLHCSLREHSNNAVTIAGRNFTDSNNAVAWCISHAAKAADVADRPARGVAVRAGDAAACAVLAGVPPRTVAEACAKCVARDLGIDLSESAQIDAAVAAVMAGELGLIAEIGERIRA